MLSTQLELPDGVLTVTVQHAPQVSVIFGLVPAGASDVHETYGGCDLPGAYVLGHALSCGAGVQVQDPGSGRMDARVDWDGETLILRAAGEEARARLDVHARRRLLAFLGAVMASYPVKPCPPVWTTVVNGRTVRFGFDVPLQYYFVTVEALNGVLYSNLDDPEAQSGTFGGGLSLEQLIEELAWWGVRVTPGLRAALDAAGRTEATSTPLQASLLRAVNGD